MEMERRDGYSSSSSSDGSNSESSKVQVKDILSLRANGAHQWINRKNPLVGADKDYAVYELERYRLVCITSYGKYIYIVPMHSFVDENVNIKNFC